MSNPLLPSIAARAKGQTMSNKTDTTQNNVIWLNDNTSRKAVIREMITRRLKKRRFADDAIQYTIDAALFYFDQGDTVYRAIYTALDFALEDFTTGPAA